MIAMLALFGYLVSDVCLLYICTLSDELRCYYMLMVSIYQYTMISVYIVLHSLCALSLEQYIGNLFNEQTHIV